MREKAVLRKNTFMAVQGYLKKQEQFQMNDPTLQLKELEKNNKQIAKSVEGDKKGLSSPCWYSTSLQTKGSLVQVPLGAHGWVVGQVSIRRCVKGNHTLMFLSLSFSHPSPLSKNI